MTRALLVSFVSLLTVGGAVSRSIAQTPRGWPGHYVSADASARIDTFVEVDVFPAYEGQALFIDFMVKRVLPETIQGAVSPAIDVGDKRFTFAFTDSRGNGGKGTFSRSGKRFLLRLERADRGGAPGDPDGPYGAYEVVRKEAAGRSDRHPWSLNKPQPPPE